VHKARAVNPRITNKHEKSSCQRCRRCESSEIAKSLCIAGFCKFGVAAFLNIETLRFQELPPIQTGSRAPHYLSAEGHLGHVAQTSLRAPRVTFFQLGVAARIEDPASPGSAWPFQSLPISIRQHHVQNCSKMSAVTVSASAMNSLRMIGTYLMLLDKFARGALSHAKSFFSEVGRQF